MKHQRQAAAACRLHLDRKPDCHTIAVVALGSIVPGFTAAAERRQLDGAAAQLQTDIMLTRSLAVARNRSVRISFGADTAGSCYIVHTGAASDCSCNSNGAPVCKAGVEPLRTVFLPANGPVSLRANVSSILFGPVKGTTTPTGTLRVLGRGDAAIHKVVNIMGRVRTCTPTPGLVGYPQC